MDTDYPSNAGCAWEFVAIRAVEILFFRLAGVVGGRRPRLRLPDDIYDAAVDVCGCVGVSAGLHEAEVP